MLSRKNKVRFMSILVMFAMLFSFANISPVAAIPALAGSYTLTDLGALYDGSNQARDINDTGQVVGNSTTTSGFNHAYLWENGALTDLGTLGGNYSDASDINNAGQVVGYSHTAGGEQHAFFWDNGAMTDLRTFGGLNSYANAVNEAGQVVGYAQVAGGQDHPFVWQNGVMTDLGTLGGNYGEATDISDNGQVVGSADTGNSEHHAFLWENGVMTDLGSLGGTRIGVRPTAINNVGQVVGSAETTTREFHAFVWENGVMTDLGTFNGSFTGATAINNAGQVIGHYDGRVGQDRAFLANMAGPNPDAIAPTAAPSISSGTAGANGWYTSDVTVNWNWTDNAGGSGIDTANCIASSTSTSEGNPITLSATCKDLAGNTGTASYDVKVDKTKPTLSPIVSPNPVLLNGTATATSGAADALSGLASSSCSALDTSSVGLKSFTCTATDNAGNSNSATATYTVIYNWSGFFQPVDNLPMLNSVKAGSAVPVKFSLAGNQGLNIFAAGYPASQQIACSSTATDAIETTVTASLSSLSYDATTDQYNYVWKTDKAWANTCRTLTVKLIDGTIHQANFKFTK